MARIIFVAAVLAVTALLWSGRHSVRGRAGNRLALMAFAALLIVTILFPAVTTVAAKFVGIGRGADLAFYLTSFGLLFLAASVYLKFRKMEDRIAALTADLALREWAAGLAAEQLGTSRDAHAPIPARADQPQIGRTETSST